MGLRAIEYAHTTDRQVHAWDLRWGRHPAMWAARYGRFRMLRRLIQLGCDVNHCDENGDGALIMVSSWTGPLDCVRLLLDHNALIEQQGSGGFRALSFAALQGHIGICRRSRVLKSKCFRKTFCA